MKKATRDNAEGVRIGNLDATEMKAAVEVIVRGMRDNPVNVAALGEDATLREKGCAVCSARWRQWRRWAATATCRPRGGLTARYWGCVGWCRRAGASQDLSDSSASHPPSSRSAREAPDAL